jgi:hypothetical protein
MKQGEMNRGTSPCRHHPMDERLRSHHLMGFEGGDRLVQLRLTVAAQGINRRLIPRQSATGMLVFSWRRNPDQGRRGSCRRWLNAKGMQP